MKRSLVFLLFITLLFSVPISFALARESRGDENEDKSAVIYYNEACGMCADYVNTELPHLLRAQGVEDIIKKDYINDTSVRPEMNERMTNLGVPLTLQAHVMTFVGDTYILGGHVPQHIIESIFQEETRQKFRRIIVYQDKMHGEVEDYKVYAKPAYADEYVGEIKTYAISTPITEYLDYLYENKDRFAEQQYEWLKKISLLPAVLISGFLDGINPCAFAVLLFFIAFLFTLKRTRAAIWRMGIVYISAIYLAYLLIGFGIFKAILFTNSPHFMAKLGSWLVIGLGAVNIIGYVFPKFPLRLKIPHASKKAIERWTYKATLPAAFVLGFLVGLCTFPCSGGIYVAIIGLLAATTTYWQGLLYMLLYNLMFVLPLIIILLLSSNKYSLEKISQWERSESKAMRMFSAVVMIVFGVIILVWFT